MPFYPSVAFLVAGPKGYKLQSGQENFKNLRFDSLRSRMLLDINAPACIAENTGEQSDPVLSGLCECGTYESRERRGPETG